MGAGSSSRMIRQSVKVDRALIAVSRSCSGLSFASMHLRVEFDLGLGVRTTQDPSRSPPHEKTTPPCPRDNRLRIGTPTKFLWTINPQGWEATSADASQGDGHRRRS